MLSLDFQDITKVNNIQNIKKYDGKIVTVLLGSLHFLKWHFLKFKQQSNIFQSPNLFLTNSFSRIHRLTNDGYSIEKDGDIIMIGTI